MAIKTCKDLKIQTVNIQAEDFVNQTRHLMLSVLWQIIRHGLMARIKARPELVSLIAENEELQTFLNLPPEEQLLRWFNAHLKMAGSPRTVRNFSEDIADGQNYLTLMSQIAPNIVPANVNYETDPARRAQLVCNLADNMGVDKFVTPHDILAGNKNLNLAFVADMFSKYPGISVEKFDAMQQQMLHEAQRQAQLKLEEDERNRQERWRQEEEERRRKWAEEDAARRAQWSHEDEARRMQMENEARMREEEMRNRELEERMRMEEETNRKAMEDEMKRLALEDQQRAMEQQLRLKEQQLRQEEDQMRRRQEQHLLQTTQQPMMAPHSPTPPQFHPNLTTNVPTNAFNPSPLPIATNVPYSPVPPMSPVPPPNSMMTMSAPMPSGPVPGMGMPTMTNMGMNSPVPPGGGLYPSGMMTTSNPMYSTNYNTYNQAGAYPPPMYQQTTVTTTYQQQQPGQPPVYIYGKIKKKAFKKAHGL